MWRVTCVVASVSQALLCLVSGEGVAHVIWTTEGLQPRQGQRYRAVEGLRLLRVRRPERHGSGEWLRHNLARDAVTQAASLWGVIRYLVREAGPLQSTLPLINY